MRSISIAGRLVGPNHPCFVIAEPGSNHNGSLGTALKLIDAAAEAGADAVKFQTFRAAEHYARSTPAFAYLQEIAPGMSTFDLIKRNELPRAWHGTLKAHAENRGILFLSTPSDRSAVDELVDQHQMPAIKIASFEAVDLPFIEYCARKGKPMLVSTGMCSLEDVGDVMETLKRSGNPDAVLLHCVSLYPTKPEQVNLRAMQTMAATFGVPVGLSDHTLGIDIPLAAVAFGACVIEKHYTLDRRMRGPDHPFALEPDELNAMVRGIRRVEAALGSGIKQMHPDEAEMARLGRRSLVARVRIPQGTRLTPEMLTTKRPGYGIRPKFLPQVIGKVARRTIEEDEVMTWEIVGDSDGAT
jgi:sialic acid synthase SpsE